MSIITIIGWLNFIVYIFVAFILLYKRKNRLSGRISYQEILENNKLVQNKYFRWLNPFENLVDTRFKVNLTTRMYWLYFILGFSSVLAFVILILKFVEAIPLALVAGFVVPSIFMYFKRRKQREYIYEELSNYISTTANYAITYGDPLNALKEVVDNNFINEPLLTDVKTMILRLENNVSMKATFAEFERKYEDNLYLHFFHQNLIVLNEQGGDMKDVLMESAQDFDDAMKLRIEMKAEKITNRKAFYNLVYMCIGMPFMFMFLMYDFYEIFTASIIGKSAFILVTVITLLIAVQQEKTFDKDSFFTKF